MFTAKQIDSLKNGLSQIEIDRLHGIRVVCVEVGLAQPASNRSGVLCPEPHELVGLVGHVCAQGRGNVFRGRLDELAAQVRFDNLHTGDLGRLSVICTVLDQTEEVLLPVVVQVEVDRRLLCV